MGSLVRPRQRFVVPLLTICAFAVMFVLPAAAQVTDTAGRLRVPDAAQFVGEPAGPPLTGEELAQRTQQVSSLLRCPVCQGMAVSDSPAEMAVNMKEQVRELLERGYTEEQILEYFELSYGQFVLLKPKFEGVNRMVWLLPLAALLLGAGVVFVKFRNLGKVQQSSAAVAEPSIQTPSETEPAADPYVARVRELVSGEKR
jgi:cytochrome c-type biogenesis protein CcmH